MQNAKCKMQNEGSLRYDCIRVCLFVTVYIQPAKAICVLRSGELCLPKKVASSK